MAVVGANLRAPDTPRRYTLAVRVRQARNVRHVELQKVEER